jgi:hypothetical protein
MVIYEGQDPVHDIRIRIRPKRYGSDRTQIRNTAGAASELNPELYPEPFKKMGYRNTEYNYCTVPRKFTWFGIRHLNFEGPNPNKIEFFSWAKSEQIKQKSLKNVLTL